MMNRVTVSLMSRILLLVAGMSVCALSQEAFDVYSVKPREKAPPGPPQREDFKVTPGGGYLSAVRLRTCIKWAYNIPESYIFGPESLGSPGWLGSDIQRYDITAKASGEPGVPGMRLMLQDLLKQEFGLTVHFEERCVKGYVLSEGKARPKLNSSESTELGRYSLIPTQGGVSFKNIEMNEFAEWLSGPFGMPISNQTALKGRYDLALDLSRYSTQEGDRQYAIAAAVADQLGLKLTKSDLPIKAFVVDRVSVSPVAR